MDDKVWMDGGWKASGSVANPSGWCCPLLDVSSDRCRLVGLRGAPLPDNCSRVPPPPPGGDFGGPVFQKPKVANPHFFSLSTWSPSISNSRVPSFSPPVCDSPGNPLRPWVGGSLPGLHRRLKKARQAMVLPPPPAPFHRTDPRPSLVVGEAFPSPHTPLGSLPCTGAQWMGPGGCPHIVFLGPHSK